VKVLPVIVKVNKGISPVMLEFFVRALKQQSFAPGEKFSFVFGSIATHQ
jgi:hypothetical protein